MGINKSLIYKYKGSVYISFKKFTLKDKTVIGLFQGNRGDNPHLDFIVKQQEPGKRLRIPTHTHWVVDLIIKMEYDKNAVKEFIEFYIELYDKIKPFRTITERNSYRIRYVKKSVTLLEKVKSRGQYSPEYLATILELFIKCEKQTANAFMFKDLLNLIKKYCEDSVDFYRLIGHSKRV
jgi:hypothetical protein